MGSHRPCLDYLGETLPANCTKSGSPSWSSAATLTSFGGASGVSPCSVSGAPGIHLGRQWRVPWDASTATLGWHPGPAPLSLPLRACQETNRNPTASCSFPRKLHRITMPISAPLRTPWACGGAGSRGTPREVPFARRVQPTNTH